MGCSGGRVLWTWLEQKSLGESFWVSLEEVFRILGISEGLVRESSGVFRCLIRKWNCHTAQERQYYTCLQAIFLIIRWLKTAVLSHLLFKTVLFLV